MVDFLCMGSNRLLFWPLLLAVCSAYAEWNSSDISVILGYTSQIRHDVSGIHSTVEFIAGTADSIDQNISDIESLVNSIETYQYDDYSLLLSISSDTDALRNYVLSIKNNVDNISTDSSAQLELVRLIYDSVKDNEYVRYDSNHNKQQISSLSVHDFGTEDIVDAVNNLTNYLCYSADYIGSFTNISANLGYLGYGYQLDNGVLRQLYYRLYGYYPTSDELERFKSYVSYAGPGLQFAESIVGVVPNLPIFSKYDRDLGTNPAQVLKYTWNNFSSYLNTASISSAAQNNVKARGAMYYLAYGTRDLTDTVIGLSNTVGSISSSYRDSYNMRVSITNSLQNIYNIMNGGNDEDYIVVNTSESGSTASIGDVTKNTIEGVLDSASFTGIVRTNIVGEVLNGDIIGRPDNAYAAGITRVTEGVDEFVLVDSLISEINAFRGPFDDVAGALEQGTVSDQAYTFSIEGEMLSSGMQDLSFQIENVSSETSSYLNLIANAACLGIYIFFIHAAWNDVVAKMPLFFGS